MTEYYRVCIVDDDELSHQMYSVLFKSILNKQDVHIDIISCYNGKEFINMFHDMKNKDIFPHAMLIDYIMPEMDGLELLHNAAKENIGLPPVIFCTGHDFIDKDLCKDYSFMHDIKIKPFRDSELTELADVLLDALQNHGRRREPV